MNKGNNYILRVDNPKPYSDFLFYCESILKHIGESRMKAVKDATPLVMTIKDEEGKIIQRTEIHVDKYL